MTKPASAKTNKRRLFFSMMPVVIPGLVIAVFGISFISRQERVKELQLTETYSASLEQVRNEIQDRVREAVERPFGQLPSAARVKSPDPDRLQQSLKEILLNNPIAQYPFLMNTDGRFIFPFPGKAGIPLTVTPFPGIKDKTLKSLYRQGESAEFRERKIGAALKFYVQCLEVNRGGSARQQQLTPYIFNAIGRCYFKLKRYPQAVSYYKSIIDLYGGHNKAFSDVSLYFTALRQIALAHRRTGRSGDAAAYYLQLYEGILQQESRGADQFAFFKNEALDYLGIHFRQDSGSSEKERFNRAVAREGLGEVSGLDISLRWGFIDEDAVTGANAGTNADAEASSDAFRFARIREFYLSADAKTQFYNAVKKARPGSGTTGNAAVTQFLRISLVAPFTPLEIAYRWIPFDPADPGSDGFYFGFMVSPAVLTTPQFRELTEKYFKNDPVQVSVTGGSTGDSKSGGPPYRLMTLPFENFFPDRAVTLLVDHEDHVTRQVRREIRFNYSLMAAFILALVVGVALFYKYQSREAELVRLKSQFTDSASHTLKTPLTRIRMIAEKLHLGWVSEEAKKKEYLQTILDESDRMNEMITNMLDFSRIEAGRKQYDMETASLPVLVRQTTDSYLGYIHAHGFRLEVEVDDTIPPLAMDTDALRLALVNLLQNAVKYSGGEKFIRVRLYGDNKNNAAVLEVEDRGIGMDEKELKKIFNRFYRAPGSHVQTVEGSGLGLFLVRHAVQAHNGGISVDSQPGSGSIFRISLPLEKNK